VQGQGAATGVTLPAGMQREHVDPRRRRAPERVGPPAPEPAALLRLQQGAGNAAVARLLAARPKSPQSLQRMIGFELESGAWRSALLARPFQGDEETTGDVDLAAENEWNPPDARKAFYEAGNIRGTADELPGRARDVEFVIKAQDESNEGAIAADFDRVGKAFGDMTGALTEPHWMWPKRKLGWNPPDEGRWLLNNRTGDPTVQLQATAGVRLEDIAEMMKGLRPDETAPTDEARDPKKQTSIATGAAEDLGDAWAVANAAVDDFVFFQASDEDWQEVDALRGLAGLMARMIIGGHPYTTDAATPTYSYPKAIAHLLPRTDFAHLFGRLPKPQQDTLQAPDPRKPERMNFVTLVMLVCDAASAGDVDLPVLGWKKWAQLDEGQIAPDLTRRAWAEGILAGEDRLSQSGYLAWLDSRKATLTEQEYTDRKRQSKQLDSLGAWKDRMDDLHGEKLPLVEFRALVLDSQETAMNVDQAKTVGLKLAKYVNLLASG
jgi:hypothetical protein